MLEHFLVETPKRLAAARRMAARCEVLSLARNAMILSDQCQILGFEEMKDLCGRLLRMTSGPQDLETLPERANEVIEALHREFEGLPRAVTSPATAREHY